MSLIHNAPAFIIILFVMVVFCVTSILVMRTHSQNSALEQDEDAISRFMDKKKHDLLTAGSPISLNAYMTMLVSPPPILFVIGYLLFGTLSIAFLAAICGILVPEGILYASKRSMDKKFELRFEQSLEQLSASLRAGMSIQMAVDSVANCEFLNEDIRSRYRKIYSDIETGIGIGPAFQAFADNTNSQDAHDVALAIRIQDTVGGREAEVISEIAANIKDRIMLRREVKSIFASTSTMVVMMDVLPYLVIVWYTLTNPDYLQIYFSNSEFILIFIACISLPFIGSMISHKALQKVRKGV